MKTIVILQNSQLSFGLDAAKIYQPNKYRLCLIVNEFGNTILKKNNQEKFYAKIHVTNDFSVENILSVIKEFFQPDSSFNVVTNAEEAMPVCGEIRKYLGLDSEDFARFYDKDVMKQKLSNCNNIQLPDYKIFDHKKYQEQKEAYLEAIIKELGLPVFTKPTNACGAVNTKKIHTLEEFSTLASNVDINDHYEVDQFINGIMYHCDSYIQNGKILFTFVAKNSRPCYDFTIGYMKGTIVLPEDHPDALLLADITEKTLQHLGMPKAGVTHLEVIKTAENKIYFIEVAHRSPGCLIPKMYSAHADIDTISAHFLLQIDPEFQLKKHIMQFAAWACYPKRPGIVTKLATLPQNINSQYQIDWYVNIGDKIESFSKFGRDYTGTIFMTNTQFDKLYQDFKRITELNLCQITAL